MHTTSGSQPGGARGELARDRGPLGAAGHVERQLEHAMGESVDEADRRAAAGPAHVRVEHVARGVERPAGQLTLEQVLSPLHAVVGLQLCDREQLGIEERDDEEPLFVSELKGLPLLESQRSKRLGHRQRPRLRVDQVGVGDRTGVGAELDSSIVDQPRGGLEPFSHAPGWYQCARLIRRAAAFHRRSRRDHRRPALRSAVPLPLDR